MADSDYVLRYNSYSEEYEVPRRRVSSLYELQSGDHIAFHRFGGAYWHHAIVENVDIERGEICAIEYNLNSRKFQVIKKLYRFSNVIVYLMLHEYFDRDLALFRAQERVGEKEYHILFNNCEHFAMNCVTGRSSSDQVNKALDILDEEVMLGLASTETGTAADFAARSALHGGRAIVKAEVGRQLVRTGAGTTAKFVAQSASYTGRAVMRTGMTQSVAQNGLYTMASDVGTGFGGILAGGALAGAFEGLSMAYDFRNLERDLETGRIDEQEFNKTVEKRVFTGTGSAVGSAAGMVFGQALIPIPVLGAAIGSVVGGVLGRVFGTITGNLAIEDD